MVCYAYHMILLIKFMIWSDIFIKSNQISQKNHL
jgi:hypothetical protein